MSNPTYYDILEILPTASPDVIKAAVNVKLKQCHPDVGGNTEDTRLILMIKDVLLNDLKRNAYDAEISQMDSHESERSAPDTVDKKTIKNIKVRKDRLVTTPDNRLGVVGNSYIWPETVIFADGTRQPYKWDVLKALSVHQLPALNLASNIDIQARDNIMESWKQGFWANFMYHIWTKCPGKTKSRKIVVLILFALYMGWLIWPILLITSYIDWAQGVPFAHQLTIKPTTKS